ncbi:MAG: hypothetical protein HY290_04245 [Planctomycetia bacterium]|nr:hypothetical protein [Planctomycetia bacterium]
MTTSALGKVHVFASDFKERSDLDAGCYANMVRVGKLAESDKTATVFVAGSALVADSKIEIITALSGAGDRKWSLEIATDGRPHVDSASLAPGKPWLAVAMRGGQVHVIDAEQGAKIATVNAQGPIPEIGWARIKGSENPLLLVATGASLNAFRVAASSK